VKSIKKRISQLNAWIDSDKERVLSIEQNISDWKEKIHTVKWEI